MDGSKTVPLSTAYRSPRLQGIKAFSTIYVRLTLAFGIFTLP